MFGSALAPPPPRYRGRMEALTRCGATWGLDVAREERPRYAPGSEPGAEPDDLAGFVPGDVPGDAGRGALEAALAQAGAAVHALAEVDREFEADRSLLDAAVQMESLADRLAAVQLGTLADIDARRAFALDGAVTLASWFRARLRLDHGDAQRRCQAAARLRRLPALRAALAGGRLRLAHVLAITRAMVPGRAEAISEVEPILVDLALLERPRTVRVAVERLRDLIDPDGADGSRDADAAGDAAAADAPGDARGDDPAEPGADPGDQPPGGAGGHALDPRRELHVWRGFEGLVEGRFTLDQLAGEALLELLNVLEEPDPPGTEAERRRSPAQRRADAFTHLCRRLLDAGDLPQVRGNAANVTALLDLAAMLRCAPQVVLRLLGGTDVSGLDGAQLTALVARLAAAAGDSAGDSAGESAGENTACPSAQPNAPPEPAFPHDPSEALRLRWTGAAPPGLLDALGPTIALSVVLTCGPWRVVNVGRRFRALPGWLRLALEWVHGGCRGPDCDRPAVWTEAHHVGVDWSAGADTDFNRSIPLCQAHHKLVTNGIWSVDYDPDTGRCTWRQPRTGTTLTTRPHRAA